jgi:protein O-GlcNAc transferase
MHPVPAGLSQVFDRAVGLHDRGRFPEAEQLYQKLLRTDERHFGALCRLGVMRLQQHRFADAERLFRRAVKVEKRSADAHQLLGFALTGLDRLEDAARSYQKAIALRPNFPEAHNNAGYALQVLGRLNEAITYYNQAIAIRPDYSEAHNNLGNALHLLERNEEAIASYRKALEIKPDYAQAYWNLGTAFRSIGGLEDAIPHYEHAIAIRPDYHEAYNSLGNTLCSLNRLEEASTQYKKALALKRDYVQAYINYGDVLFALGRDDEAIATFDAALALKPNDPNILSKRGAVFARGHRYREAIASFEAGFASDADDGHAFDGLAGCARKICDWTRAATLTANIEAHVVKGLFLHPFNFLSYSSNAELQLKCAKRFVKEEIPVRPQLLWTGETWCNKKIKIAYVATGFHNHPTAYLIAELVEIHDRSRFEILGVSLGPDDQTDIRARLIRAFDQFYDMRGKSDRDVAMQLHEMQVDIVVDASGYIADARPAIFAFRPAPIQVNYLAYPGTLGATFYDYIVADATVLPFEQRSFYSENIVHLPDCYQVNDSKRAIAVHTPTREEAGLPRDGFVFCCFNNCYKITPAVFDIWMRLLHRVEGSVLWLLCEREMAEANLCREASARGIDASRLVFARRVPLQHHLARHRLADLFLDTLPYNAHTTASDALWAGLPVITCYGDAFAGRVAASLLRAIGMPDLVTYDLAAYASLAERLAREPSILDEVRDRLRRNRLSQPLFDSDRYRCHIEAAYVRMWELWQSHKTPHSFTIEPASARSPAQVSCRDRDSSPNKKP